MGGGANLDNVIVIISICIIYKIGIIRGEALRYDGSSKYSVDNNLGKAEAYYYKHQQVLRNPVQSVGKRLQAWM